MVEPQEVQLEIEPSKRVDFIDVTERLEAATDTAMGQFPRTLYCSHHTTAGYLDQSLCNRLEHSRDRLGSFLGLFQAIFPPGADYEHDKLHLRHELSDQQRATEPKNADSHLAFISSGLKNCVTYRSRTDAPVFFIDLDGVHEHGVRRRSTTVIGYNRSDLIETVDLAVPVSSHPIDSVNLSDPRFGLFEEIEELLQRHEVAKGRVDITVDPRESHTGLTVNEYETLLMRHDLMEVLRDPVRFMAEKGRNMLRDPRAIPNKTRNYAKYDFVRFLNETMDAFGISESILERMVARLMAVPASRFLRMKRAVSLPVSDSHTPGKSTILQGTYQSPILVQWEKAPQQVRHLHLSLIRFS